MKNDKKMTGDNNNREVPVTDSQVCTCLMSLWSVGTYPTRKMYSLNFAIFATRGSLI